MRSDDLSVKSHVTFLANIVSGTGVIASCTEVNGSGTGVIVSFTIVIRFLQDLFLLVRQSQALVLVSAQ